MDGMRFLAIDIGSSLIKWTRVAMGEMGKVWKKETAPFVSRDGVRCELDLTGLAAFLQALIQKENDREPVEGVYLSVQMHGVVLLSPRGEAVCPFVTWEDTRGLLPMKCGLSALKYVSRELEGSIKNTGVWLNPGFSVVQLTALRDQGTRLQGRRMAMLGDALTSLMTGAAVPIHVTNACSSGLYDLREERWSDEILQKLSMEELKLPAVTKDVSPVAGIRVRGKEIPIFCAVGDLQASVLGADLEPGELMINIATGSQLILPTGELAFGSHETRAYFGGQYLKTITHIPAGRSLTRLIAFFQDMGKRLFDRDISQEKIWERVTEAAALVDGAQDMRVDLHFYDGKEKKQYGSITGVTAENLYFENIMLAAYQGMAANYYRLYRQMNCEKDVAGLCLAGGVIKRTPALARLIHEAFQLPVRVTKTEESSLNGLAKLSKAIG